MKYGILSLWTADSKGVWIVQSAVAVECGHSPFDRGGSGEG